MLIWFRIMKKYLLLGLILLILLLSLSVTVVFVSRRTSWFGSAYGPERAQRVEGEISLENSYLFASPLTAAADGKEKIRLTVFVLNNQGRGVYGQTVALIKDESLTAAAVQSTTDQLGQAIFEVAALSAGEYFLQAQVGGRLLSQKVRVVFRPANQ